MQNNYEMIRMCILTFGLAGLVLGRYEKTATSWLGNFASGNIRHDHITAGGLLEKSGMVFGIIAGDIYAYTGLEYKGKYWVWRRSGNFRYGMFLCTG